MPSSLRGLRVGMRHRHALAFAASLGLALGAAALGRVPPAAGQGEMPHRVYLPASVDKGDFEGRNQVLVPQSTATQTGPTPTRTPRIPGGTDGPTPTSQVDPTRTATPQPTASGGHVGHPTGEDTIILQIGQTETDEPDSVFEEMNGTPWFTLYGDGTVIFGGTFGDREQPQYTLKVTEDQVQIWLQELTYGVQFYRFDSEYYLHPASEGKPVLNVYVYTTGGLGKRVGVAGWSTWERRAAESHPYNSTIRRLIVLVRAIETWAKAQSGEAYLPEMYTFIARKPNPRLLPEAPPWEGINPVPVAEAAPTAASNYVDKVPGHKFVGGQLGREMRALVIPEWLRTWNIYNQAAEFEFAGRTYVIGVRKEVPGGSLFLAANVRAAWYRRDVGDDLATLADVVGWRPDRDTQIGLGTRPLGWLRRD